LKSWHFQNWLLEHWQAEKTESTLHSRSTTWAF
jgi:hypothetical protein